MKRKYTRRNKKAVIEKTIEPSTQPEAELIVKEPTPAGLEAIEPLVDEAVAEVEEPVGNVNNCEYRLIMVFNGETFSCYTNNLSISIQSFGREVLTEMYIKITKGQSEFEKRLNLVQGKKLFNDPQSLEIFLETFYSLYGRPQNAPRVN